MDKKFHNDIALLQLDKPIEFTPLAFPVCINRGKLLYPPGVRCIVTGWGRTKREFGPAANVLQELRVCTNLSFLFIAPRSLHRKLHLC